MHHGIQVLSRGRLLLRLQSASAGCPPVIGRVQLACDPGQHAGDAANESATICQRQVLISSGIGVTYDAGRDDVRVSPAFARCKPICEFQTAAP